MRHFSFVKTRTSKLLQNKCMTVLTTFPVQFIICLKPFYTSLQSYPACYILEMKRNTFASYHIRCLNEHFFFIHFLRQLYTYAFDLVLHWNNLYNTPDVLGKKKITKDQFINRFTNTKIFMFYIINKFMYASRYNR